MDAYLAPEALAVNNEKALICLPSALEDMLEYESAADAPPLTQNKERVICCACIMGTWCIHDAHKQCKIHKTPQASELLTIHTWLYLASSSSLGQWGQVRYDTWVAHIWVVTL